MLLLRGAVVNIVTLTLHGNCALADVALSADGVTPVCHASAST